MNYRPTILHFSRYHKTHTEFVKLTTCSFINPDYGWDVISITEKSMRMILHSIKVFTPFFKYIRAFGIKSFSKDEGYGGFDLNISKDPSSNTNCFGL